MTVELDLDKFRSLLEGERDRLVGAIEAVNHRGSLMEETGDLATGPGDHYADNATETFLRELDNGLEEDAGQMVAEIDAALRRIEEGTYGTCVACGKPIGEERLEAIPYATLCIDDKRRLERA
jgi:DnaK suppressor protein